MKKLYYYFLVLLISLISCQKTEYYERDLIDVDILFSTGQLQPHFDVKNYQYDITSLNTINPMEITVKCSDNSFITINGEVAYPNKPHALKLDKLSWDKTLPITIDDKVYKINLISTLIPRFGVTYTTPSEGNIYYAAGEKGGYVTILTNKGEVIYYNTEYDCNSFRKEHNLKGETRYVAFKGLNVPTMQGAGYGKGSIIIMDEKFNVVKEVFPKSEFDFTESYAEGHDFIYLDDNHFIFCMYSPRVVHNIPGNIPQNSLGTRVLSAHLQEVIDDKVVWEWQSVDYPAFYASSVEGNDYTNTSAQWADYMHSNSICIDPQDNNLIISLRRQCSIIKIDRKTGKLIWTLSGKDDDFGLNEQQQLKFQHFARIFHNADGTKTITAYDNRTGEVLSRLAEYKIDDRDDFRLIDFKEIVGPYSGYFNGSVQKLENTYFFNWGGPKSTIGHGDMTEVSSDGKIILFDLFFVKSPNNVWSYRAYKIK